MTLVFENDLVAPTLTLAVAYLLLSIYACRRLISLHKKAPEMNTRKLFVMTCLLTTILRLMTFGSMTAFNYAEFHLKVRTDIIPTGDDIIVTDAFFEKATLVLLDIPDWCCISAYVLLIVVCAEALLQSRRHWLSSFEFRRMWILGYLVFNTILYSLQVLLYSLLFLPSINQEVLSAMIYLTLTFFNLGLPVVWMLGFVFLSVRFAGFPFSSLNAKKRLNSLVRLGRLYFLTIMTAYIPPPFPLRSLYSIWTVARLGWGFIALTSVMQDWLVQVQKTVPFYSLILISVFFFAEILPIAFSLQNDCLESLTEKSKPLDLAIDDVTSNWEEKMISRSGRSRTDEYDSIPRTERRASATSSIRATGQPIIQIPKQGKQQTQEGGRVRSQEPGDPLSSSGLSNSIGNIEVRGAVNGGIKDNIQRYYQLDKSQKKSLFFPTLPSSSSSLLPSGNGYLVSNQSGGREIDVDRDYNRSINLQQDYFSLPCLESNSSDNSKNLNSSNRLTNSNKYAEISAVSNIETGRGLGKNSGKEVGNSFTESEEFDTENGEETPYRERKSNFWSSSNRSPDRGYRDEISSNYYPNNISNGNNIDKQHYDFYSSYSNQQSIDSEMSAVGAVQNKNTNSKTSLSLREKLGKVIYNSERKWGSWFGL